MSNSKGRPENLKKFSSMWKSKETCVIRIPFEHKQQILAYAQELDSGEPLVTRGSEEVDKLSNRIKKLEEQLEYARNQCLILWKENDELGKQDDRR